MTDSFGVRLRRERERQHITLSQIASATKIKASLFEALERDDVSRWPAGIFRRSFIREYAEFIGLDPDEVCREFVNRHPEPGDDAQPAPAVVPPFTPVPAVSMSDQDQERLDPPSPAPAVGHGLRLTLADPRLPFTSGRLLRQVRQRCSAIAWDVGSLLVVAVSAFIFFDIFWLPLGVATLCYYCGGILVLGNTPGVWLFAPRPRQDDQAEATVRHAAPEVVLRPLDDLPSESISMPSRVTYSSLHQPVDIDGTGARA